VKAISIHSRRIEAPLATVGGLIDTLASPDDRLWPHADWPAMRFDRPLGVGAAGGHAFIRYSVEDYQEGRSILFRITGPKGFSGTHALDVLEDGSATVLTHTIDGEITMAFAPKWFGVVRPLHDALMGDALDNAERETTGAVRTPARWSWWTRVLRKAFRRRR
jgi:hypothetical protein